VSGLRLFERDGAAHEKAQEPNLVFVRGCSSNCVPDEQSDLAGLCSLIMSERYDGLPDNMNFVVTLSFIRLERASRMRLDDDT
jgi:hypothetical protein